MSLWFIRKAKHSYYRWLYSITTVPLGCIVVLLVSLVLTVISLLGRFTR